RWRIGLWFETPGSSRPRPGAGRPSISTQSRARSRTVASRRPPLHCRVTSMASPGTTVLPSGGVVTLTRPFCSAWGTSPQVSSGVAGSRDARAGAAASAATRAAPVPAASLRSIECLLEGRRSRLSPIDETSQATRYDGFGNDLFPFHFLGIVRFATLKELAEGGEELGRRLLIELVGAAGQDREAARRHRPGGGQIGRFALDHLRQSPHDPGPLLLGRLRRPLRLVRLRFGHEGHGSVAVVLVDSY